MKVYRSTMEKQMDELENAQVITNPKEPFKTFLRKLAYRWAAAKQCLRHPLGGRGGAGK